MNRLQKLQFLKDVSEGRIQPLDFEDHILIIDDQNKPLLNDRTVLSSELIRIIKKNYLEWAGNPCRILCHVDSDNQVQAGIKKRKPRSDKNHKKS